jgi:DNA/RNA-binding domain of Phe-tRNA-synthetase-like protein
MQEMMNVSQSWKDAYPGAVIGLLVMHGARNPTGHAGLEDLKTKLEGELRERFMAGSKEALKAEPAMAAYIGYYRKFKKSYHVALQLESIIWKGRSIPSVSSLVEAMFMAELKNMLLTAGHDLGALSLPLTIDVAAGTERYTTMRGEEQVLKAGDMRISDSGGIISCILYGPDQRTRISERTRDVVFTVYAPAGVGDQRVRAHLEDIQGFVRVVSPDAATERLEIFS